MAADLGGGRRIGDLFGADEESGLCTPYPRLAADRGGVGERKKK
jgi:hypothetical protein